MKPIILTITIISALFASTAARANRIVDTNHQKYTYAEMLENLDALQSAFPDWITFEHGDTTFEGRTIPLVTLGRDDAPHHIMIQASMHAREYMSTHLVMAMIENLARQRADSLTYRGHKISDITDKVQFTIIPMVNPDGVEIAQFGIDGAIRPETKLWLRPILESGINHDQIKSNARGVDLNRNFTNGHGRAYNAKTAPHLYHFPGHAPHSEPEVAMMLSTLARHNYDLCLNYHTSGNLLYYGCGNAPAEVNSRAHHFASIINKKSGFPLHGPKKAEKPNGSWADEVELHYNIPSVTVELGTRNPVPIQEMPLLLQKNSDTWLDIILSLITP